MADDSRHDDGFQWQADRFADVRVLRFQVPGWEALDLRTRTLLYHLTEAALSGRDITWDQNYRHNLVIRRTLEAIDRSWQGERSAEFDEYLKRVWFSQGIHHHASTKKFLPGFSRHDLKTWVGWCAPEDLPLREGETPDALVDRLGPVLFDPAVDPVRVCLDDGVDHVAGSACNFYGEGVGAADVTAFYKAREDDDPERPVMHGLNSRLERDASGQLVERVWRVGGLYGEALERVVEHLRAAAELAESDEQRRAIELLVDFYHSGELTTFDAYSVAWLEDTASRVDAINGFIESYGDPMDMRGTWEALVGFTDAEATGRIEAISGHAAWFERHSPIDDAYKKDEVTGISARVLTVVSGGGDTHPAFPLGINLPNSDWIRRVHGSKSVNLGNIAHAYDMASKEGGLLEEFCATEEALRREQAHGALASALHTDLHEVIGHASGRLAPGVAPMSETLKAYASPLEEARADLTALYFLMDEELVRLGVMPDLEVGRASYDAYIRNGAMTQLARVPLGETLQQAHMRNRQLIARWVIERGRGDGVIERIAPGGKTGFAVRDHVGLRALFGELLREIQRIKSEGDFEAGRALVEDYGVRIERGLHEEVLERYGRLDIPPYAGFINPKLTAVRDDAGAITDVRLEVPTDFAAQMREYSRRVSLLPAYP